MAAALSPKGAAVPLLGASLPCCCCTVCGSEKRNNGDRHIHVGRTPSEQRSSLKRLGWLFEDRLALDLQEEIRVWQCHDDRRRASRIFSLREIRSVDTVHFGKVAGAH